MRVRAFWLMLWICPAFGQPVPGPGDYESFFRTVAQLGRSDVHQLTPHEAFGLTEEQEKTLKSIALDCEAKGASFDKAISPLVFESRLQSLDSGETESRTASRLRELNARRMQMVQEHLQQLRAALGESQFQIVDDFIRARKPGAPFFPIISATGEPVPVPVVKRR